MNKKKKKKGSKNSREDCAILFPIPWASGHESKKSCYLIAEPKMTNSTINRKFLSSLSKGDNSSRSEFDSLGYKLLHSGGYNMIKGKNLLPSGAN